MSEVRLYETDAISKSVERFGDVVVRALVDELDVDAQLDRVDFVATLDKSTLTIVVSWDPNAEPPSGDTLRAETVGATG